MGAAGVSGSAVVSCLIGGGGGGGGGVINKHQVQV